MIHKHGAILVGLFTIFFGWGSFADAQLRKLNIAYTATIRWIVFGNIHAHQFEPRGPRLGMGGHSVLLKL